MKKRTKAILILKAILFYVTMIGTMLYIAGIDSILDKGYCLPVTMIVATLIYLCLYTIRKDELDTILLNRLFDRLIGSSEE